MLRTIVTVVATTALALLTAGCGAPSDVPEVTAPGDGPDTAGATAVPSAGTHALSQRCENPREGYAISYPRGWHTDRGEGIIPCRAFDPEPVELEPQTEIPLDTAVIVSTSGAASLEELADEDIGATDRETERTRVAGHDAIVVDATGTGAGMVGEGVAFRSYHIDLGHRIVVATSFDVGEPDLASKRAVLDEMVETIEVITGEADRG